jgi:hypothetical protein
MLFELIYVYRCQARLPYQMMFVPSISNTMSVTSGAGDDNPSGAPWLTPFLFDL